MNSGSCSQISSSCNCPIGIIAKKFEMMRSLFSATFSWTSPLSDRNRPRAVSLFSWSVEQNARDTQMTTSVTEGARQAVALVSRVSRFRRTTLTRACTPLTKSKEKERLLAV